jgi:hypothetical protein
MARQILLQGGAVVHEAAHDVESFIWVLSYCVMRNLCYRASQSSAPEVRNQCRVFRSLFREAFGRTTAKAIAHERHSMCYALIFIEDNDVNEVITKCMSEPLIALFHDLRGLMHRLDDPFNPTPLTHDSLLAVVDQRLSLCNST